GLLAASSASASSLLQPCAVCALPAATGFMPTVRSPRPRFSCSSATEAEVLPTPVSVPVTHLLKLTTPPPLSGRRPSAPHATPLPRSRTSRRHARLPACTLSPDRARRRC